MRWRPMATANIMGSAETRALPLCIARTISSPAARGATLDYDRPRSQNNEFPARGPLSILTVPGAVVRLAAAIPPRPTRCSGMKDCAATLLPSRCDGPWQQF